VNRMIEAGVSVSLHIYIHIVHSFSFFSQSALPSKLFSLRRRFEIERKRFKIFGRNNSSRAFFFRDRSSVRCYFGVTRRLGSMRRSDLII
jgi:hypothetical protein